MKLLKVVSTYICHSVHIYYRYLRLRLFERKHFAANENNSPAVNAAIFHSLLLQSFGPPFLKQVMELSESLLKLPLLSLEN